MRQPHRLFVLFAALLATTVPGLAEQPAIVNIAALDAVPARIAYQAPRVPDALAVVNQTAEVTLTLVVNAQGEVSGVEGMQAATPELATAAETAVRAWRFQPGTMNAQPVSFRVPVTLAFRPGQAPAQALADATPDFQVAPVYPAELRDSARDGLAIVSVFVDAAGTPGDVVVELASHPAFAAPAAEAVRTWTFAPARRGEMLVAVRTQVIVEFRAADARRTAEELRRDAQLAAMRAYDVAPEALERAPLIYPFDALIQQERGMAILTVVISPEGKIAAARIERATTPEFGQAARACVAAWTFRPATKAGHAVFGQIEWEVAFHDGVGELQFDESAHELLAALRAGTLQLASARELDAPLRPIQQVEPRLPPEVDRTTASGEVLVQVIIDRRGRVQLPRIMRAPSPEIGYAAATAAARWRFDPPMKAGEPVAVRVAIPFRFRLPDAAPSSP